MAKKKQQKKKKKGTSSGRNVLLKAVLIGLSALVVGIMVLIALVRNDVFGKLPTEAELADLKSEEATLILAQDGALIGKVFAKDRTNVRYADLPKHLIEALVATEDQRFFTHEGVDAWSYARVFFRTIIGRDRSGGGGSTISQQIIKNLYGRERHGLLTVPVNKIKEALVAQRLERVYTKEDVLTLYFNSVPFGENMYGVEAAAQRYFSKATRNLAPEESAVLVGMLKANTTYNPRLNPEAAKGRRDQVLALMATRGYLTEAAKNDLQQRPLRVRYMGVDALDAYGYFAARVEKDARAILDSLAGRKGGHRYDIEKDGLRIHTTLDTALQQVALRSMKAQLARMQPKLDQELRGRKARAAWEKRMGRRATKAWDRNRRAVREVFRWDDAKADTLSYRDSLWHYHRLLNAAVLMMEPGTGRVRAWVGGNDHRLLPFDLVETHRPIASTIKPVIYAAGVGTGLGPCTYLDNGKKIYAAYDNWSPSNFDNDTSGGHVAMWYALAHSMNLPTVDLYFRTGQDTIRQVFRALGLPEDNIAKPALALGAADISLKEIVRAYGAFAMRGRVTQQQLIDRITDAQGKVLYQAKPARTSQALPPEVAATITTMLQRAVLDGTGAKLRSVYGVRSPFAGKTGTSQDFSDAWFVGYTPGLVIGTWVGARDPEMHFVSSLGTGGSLALPIVGGTVAAIERSPALRGKYLRPFDWTAEFEVDTDCPERQSDGGVERLLEGLFKSEKSKERTPTVKDPVPDRPKKGFLQRIFPPKRRR
ncbi:MAG: transglycosylase domain-containing protein [Flavobacteriales bacterium]